MDEGNYLAEDTSIGIHEMITELTIFNPCAGEGSGEG